MSFFFETLYFFRFLDSSLFANVFSSSNPPVENDFQPSPIKTLSRHSSYLQNGDQDECFPSMDFKEPSASPIKDFDELSLSPKKLFNEPQPSPEKENQNPYEDLSSSSSARYTPEDLPSPESKKRIPPPKTPPSPKKPKAEWTGLSQGHLEALVNIYPPINEEALSEIAKGLNYVYTMKQILEKGKRLNLFTIDEELEEKVLEKESKKDKEEKDQVFIDQVMKEGLSQNEQEGIQDFYYEHDQEVDEDNDDEKERYYQECLEAGMYQNRDQEDPDQHDDDDRQDFYQPEREDDDVYQQRYHREDRYQKGDSDGDAKHMDDAEYARHLQEQYYREEDSNDGYYRRNYRRQDYRRERYQREEYRQRDYDEADYQEEEYRSREDHEKAPEHEEVHMKKENEEEEMDIDVET